MHRFLRQGLQFIKIIPEFGYCLTGSVEFLLKILSNEASQRMRLCTIFFLFSTNFSLLNHVLFGTPPGFKYSIYESCVGLFHLMLD